MALTRRQLITQVMGNFGAMRRTLACITPGKSAKKHHLTHAQLGVLMIVERHGAQTIKQLAEQFSMTSSAATQLVNGLVKCGLLLRKENTKDRRSMDVSLSPLGKLQLKAAMQQRLASLTQLLSPLSDNELDELYRLQQKILKSAHTL